MWAKAAIQDLTDPDHVELKTLRAKVMMEDKSTVTMDARTGYFDSKQQMLDLRKDIFLQSSTGYEAELSQAYVDINKGTVTSDEHVDVKLLNGTLTADKLRIINSGEVVRFEGNVVMNLVMESPPAPEPRARAAARRRKTRSVIRQVRQHEMIFMMQFSLAQFRRGGRCALALAFALAGDARAQGAVSGVPNAMQGFSQNRDQPIQIEAASLEMRDKKKEATFAGNVKVVQGDTTMTSKTLVVFYDSGVGAGRAAAGQCRRRAKSAPMQSATPGPGRQFVDPPAGSQGQRRRHAEGAGRDRGDRDLRHQGQPHHHGGRRGADPVQERAARRPPDGGHDDRRVAGGIRQRQGAGPVHPADRAAAQAPGGAKPAPAGIPSLIPGKK